LRGAATTRIPRAGCFNAYRDLGADGTADRFRARRGGADEFTRGAPRAAETKEPVLAAETKRAASDTIDQFCSTDGLQTDSISSTRFPAVASGTDLVAAAAYGRLRSRSSIWHRRSGRNGCTAIFHRRTLLSPTLERVGRLKLCSDLSSSDRKWQVSINADTNRAWRAGTGARKSTIFPRTAADGGRCRAGPSFEVPKLLQTRVPAGVTANRQH